MFLKVATTAGALVGAYLTARVSSHRIAIVFGVVLLYSAYVSFKSEPENLSATKPNTLATKLKLFGSYAGPTGREQYCAQNVPVGFGIMFGAGMQNRISGVFPIIVEAECPVITVASDLFIDLKLTAYSYFRKRQS
jgi:uncharacterized membrane protein YfcA